MKKIEFKNNSEPYLSAENLNQMQDNIENVTPREITIDGEITKTGRKIFGKDEYVYTKKITSITSISTGLTDVDYVTDIKCMVLDTVNTNGVWRPIPWCFNASSYDGTYNGGINFNPSSGNVSFQVGSGISNNVGKGIVSIYFTYKD